MNTGEESKRQIQERGIERRLALGDTAQEAVAWVIAVEIHAQLRGKNLKDGKDVDDGIPSFEETRLSALRSLQVAGAHDRGKELLTTQREWRDALDASIKASGVSVEEFAMESLGDATAMTIMAVFLERYELSSELEAELGAGQAERFGFRGGVN